MTELTIQTGEDNNNNRPPGWTLETPERRLAADGNAPNPLAMQERVEDQQMEKKSYFARFMHYTMSSR